MRRSDHIRGCVRLTVRRSVSRSPPPLRYCHLHHGITEVSPPPPLSQLYRGCATALLLPPRYHHRHHPSISITTTIAAATTISPPPPPPSKYFYCGCLKFPTISPHFSHQSVFCIFLTNAAPFSFHALPNALLMVQGI